MIVGGYKVTQKEKTVAPFCGFCGKSNEEAGKLIQGPENCICDECIGLMVDIVREELDREFKR